MDEPKFVQLVAAMREAQQDYFATREPEALSRSKMLERQVDEQLAYLKSGQQELF